MAIVQLRGSKRFDTQMEVHTATKNTDVSLAQGFQKHFSNESGKHGITYNVKHLNVQVKKRGGKGGIM